MARKTGLLSLPLVCLVLWLWGSHLAWGQARALGIDPEDATRITATEVPFQPKVLLAIGQLPKHIPPHPALLLENRSFTYVTLSPDEKALAFCVKGKEHQWTGLLDLPSSQIKPLALTFEGEAANPHFSEDGRYLTLEERRGPAQLLEVFDLKGQSQCRLSGRKARDKFLNFSQSWWSPEGDRIYFKVEYNNPYRKSLGLRPKDIPARIGESGPDCGKIKYYSVGEFMEKFPTESPYHGMALKKTQEE